MRWGSAGDKVGLEVLQELEYSIWRGRCSFKCGCDFDVRCEESDVRDRCSRKVNSTRSPFLHHWLCAADDSMSL